MDDFDPPSAGLTSSEAQARLTQYGPNALEEKRPTFGKRIFKLLRSPMSLMFTAAALLSVAGGNPEDAAIIAALFITNIAVSVWHEAKADTALEKLQQKLSIDVSVLRDGAWQTLPSRELVPGDHLRLSGGNILPADITFTSAHSVSINQAAITGESLPVEKKAGDSAYAGAFLTTGIAEANVTATGAHTYMASSVTAAGDARPQSSLERDIYSVSKFLSAASISITIVLGAALAFEHKPLLEIATLGISMLIAGIPVALPTVMTLIISLGVLGLAKRAVVVRRLSSLEDLADTTLLLSDKTGTLTQNHIVAQKMVPLSQSYPEETLWQFAAVVARVNGDYPTDKAIADAAVGRNVSIPKVEQFIPGDSDRKRSTAFLPQGDSTFALSLGAPQAVAQLCAFTKEAREGFDEAVAAAAHDGQRVLALAVGTHGKEEQMEMLAVFCLADALRPEAAETIRFMQESGIEVKMVTGDSYGIAVNTAKMLGLRGEVLRRGDLAGAASLATHFAGAAAFAEVLPKDKYDLVMLARSLPQKPVVAVTGDGVNDVPAVKAANVGVAVPGAVDALRGSADIVLTEGGIGVIKDAVIEARKIFVRLYNYSVYRIAESFRLIVTIAVLGLLFGAYPLSPVQLILIALLNDIPIVSLALDRVAVPRKPTRIDVRKRLFKSLTFGVVGVANSLLLVYVALYMLHVPWAVFQTMFFLKLTVSGHMLIYIAHTEEKWWRFLPSRAVIAATTATQMLATLLAFFGLFAAPISIGLIALVWVWSFFWMQVGELAKHFLQKQG